MLEFYENFQQDMLYFDEAVVQIYKTCWFHLNEPSRNEVLAELQNDIIGQCYETANNL